MSCCLIIQYLFDIWSYFSAGIVGNNYSTWAWNYFRVVYSDDFLTDISVEGEAQWILDSLRKLYLERLCGWIGECFPSTNLSFLLQKEEKNARKKQSFTAQNPYLRLLLLGMQSINKGQISEKLEGWQMYFAPFFLVLLQLSQCPKKAETHMLSSTAEVDALCRWKSLQKAPRPGASTLWAGMLRAAAMFS